MGVNSGSRSRSRGRSRSRSRGRSRSRSRSRGREPGAGHRDRSRRRRRLTMAKAHNLRGARGVLARPGASPPQLACLLQGATLCSNTCGARDGPRRSGTTAPRPCCTHNLLGARGVLARPGASPPQLACLLQGVRPACVSAARRTPCSNTCGAGHVHVHGRGAGCRGPDAGAGGRSRVPGAGCRTP
jgi:hypothetical protein